MAKHINYLSTYANVICKTKNNFHPNDKTPALPSPRCWAAKTFNIRVGQTPSIIINRVLRPTSKYTLVLIFFYFCFFISVFNFSPHVQTVNRYKRGRRTPLQHIYVGCTTKARAYLSAIMLKNITQPI